MKNQKPTPLSVDIKPVRQLVLDAVNEDRLSLNQIAKMTGLSVPAIARIYHTPEGSVHPRTAQAIQEGLEERIQKSKTPGTVLSARDREQIIDVMTKTLRRELNRLVK